MNRFVLIVLMPVFLVTMGNYCETDLIDDPGFQFWCGEELCAWQLEAGAVRKAPSWHEHDYAVELVGAPVVLSQQASRGFPSCVRLEVIADVEPRAMVSIEIDYTGDGSVDWQAPIQQEGFRTVAWELREGAAPQRDSVFYVRKASEGRAVIMQLRASSECETYP
jgi:hypothetical protein